jgi:hypothetical protein
MGAKEPGSITERAIKLNPGIENSPVGAKIIAGAMNADLQRKRDFYQFLSGNDNSPTADIEFNKLHPPQQYIKEAQTLAMTPSSDVKLLLQYANDPRAVSAFDQKYGNGMSRYFTGQ